MVRIKRASPDEIRALRRALHEDVAAGGLTVPETIRRMRDVMRLSQARFGQVFGLTPRQVWELEAGAANPTLATLTRLGKPFGFQGGFILRSQPVSRLASRASGVARGPRDSPQPVD